MNEQRDIIAELRHRAWQERAAAGIGRTNKQRTAQAEFGARQLENFANHIEAGHYPEFFAPSEQIQHALKLAFIKLQQTGGFNLGPDGVPLTHEGIQIPDVQAHKQILEAIHSFDPAFEFGEAPIIPQQLEKPLAEYYVRKFAAETGRPESDYEGKLWVSWDAEYKRFDIRGEALPAHPDLVTNSPNGWSLLDHESLKDAQRILKNAPEQIKALETIRSWDTEKSPLY